MIADILRNLATPKSMRIRRGRLSKQRIDEAFSEVRVDLGARTLHREVCQLHRATDVRWSLWIEQFVKHISWLLRHQIRLARPT